MKPLLLPSHRASLVSCCVLGILTLDVTWADTTDSLDFVNDIEPILVNYCFDCHGDGASKGGVALDEALDAVTSGKGAGNFDLWHDVLKNVRAGLMPQPKKDHPTHEEKARLVHWLKYSALDLSAENPDPGRVTVRRMNRTEYRNTVRDLLGVNYDTEVEFPPDDTGYGFDNIGDVLSMSPLLAEKYLTAANAIVDEAVPRVTKSPNEQLVTGTSFKKVGEDGENRSRDRGETLSLSFYESADLERPIQVEQDGDYEVHLQFTVRGPFDFDPGRCQVQFAIDGHEVLDEELQWQNRKRYEFTYPVTWKAGAHHFGWELDPLVSEDEKGDGVTLRLERVLVKGPLAKDRWVHPPNYARFFHADEPPEDPTARRAYTEEVIERFVSRAYRRPGDPTKVKRLAAIAEQSALQPGWTYERGVGQAFAAALASPRFLYRIEESLASDSDERYPRVDEYALASRLSYFLWSSMPDDELFDLASQGKLRDHLDSQIVRMLEDDRSREFIEHFAGQWLQVRNVDLMEVDERRILARDAGTEKELKREEEEYRARIEEFREERRKLAEENAQRAEQGLPPLPRQRRQGRFRRPEPPAVELDGELRRAFRRETQQFFEHVVRKDRSILEFLDSDYTFLNERLAKHYGVPGVEGNEMRLVKLPEDSPRGGILTQGSVLLITSNPTRTSPVKRGLFVLDNLLGTPPPPPPEDVPTLEESEEEREDGHEPSLKEALQQHRSQSICFSCHQRMDPLGLALENFNALGMWRDEERSQRIEAEGMLITGEQFNSIGELKRVLREDRREDFYRCFTEKLFTYALGRGPEYYDVESIDRIVARLEASGGKFSEALKGIIDSAAFQRHRKQLPSGVRPANSNTTPSQP